MLHVVNYMVSWVLEVMNYHVQEHLSAGKLLVQLLNLTVQFLDLLSIGCRFLLQVLSTFGATMVWGLASAAAAAR